MLKSYFCLIFVMFLLYSVESSLPHGKNDTEVWRPEPSISPKKILAAIKDPQVRLKTCEELLLSKWQELEDIKTKHCNVNIGLLSKSFEANAAKLDIQRLRAELQEIKEIFHNQESENAILKKQIDETKKEQEKQIARLEQTIQDLNNKWKALESPFPPQEEIDPLSSISPPPSVSISFSSSSSDISSSASSSSTLRTKSSKPPSKSSQKSKGKKKTPDFPSPDDWEVLSQPLSTSSERSKSKKPTVDFEGRLMSTSKQEPKTALDRLQEEGFLQQITTIKPAFVQEALRVMYVKIHDCKKTHTTEKLLDLIKNDFWRQIQARINTHQSLENHSDDILLYFALLCWLANYTGLTPETLQTLKDLTSLDNIFIKIASQLNDRQQQIVSNSDLSHDRSVKVGSGMIERTAQGTHDGNTLTARINTVKILHIVYKSNPNWRHLFTAPELQGLDGSPLDAPSLNLLEVFPLYDHRFSPQKK